MKWIEDISFKQVLDNSKQAFAMVGCDLKFIWCNDSFLKMFGYDKETMYKKTIFDISDNENHELTREIIEGVVSGVVQDMQFVKKYVRQDGSTFFGKITVTFIPKENCGQSLFFGCIEEVKHHEKKNCLLQSLMEISENLKKADKDNIV